MKARTIKRRRDNDARERPQNLPGQMRSPEEQAWLDLAPVGREFGSPDWERLSAQESGAIPPIN